MKKYLIIFFLLFASLSFAAERINVARMNVGIVGGGSAASCTGVQDSASGTGGFALIPGYSASYERAGLSFTASASYTAKKFVVRLVRSTLAPTFTLTGYFCTTTGSPAVPSGTCTASTDTPLDSSTIALSYTNYTFNFAGYSISSSTRYWIVLQTSAVGDSTHYVSQQEGSTGTENVATYGFGGWTNLDATATGNFSVSCD